MPGMSARGWALVVGACGSLLGPAGPAAATPIEFVEQRDSYMLFRDVDGSIENADWFNADPFFAAYGDVEAGFLANHADDSQFLIILTTWQLPPPVGALYQSVANDVHGIGYEHIAPLDLVIPDQGNGYFDATPNSQIYGFLHMNQWTQYLGGDPGGVDDNLISLIFGQEIGHAWLAFVHDGQGGVEHDDMLGRAAAHWSFYLATGGSPVEGHDWVDNGNGTFTAIKHPIYVYSDLDLYLMGLLPADEVEPWFVLENVSNCVDSAQMDGSCAPPDAFLFQADSYTVNATRRDITIDDVIAIEGPRIPAFGEAPTDFDMSFLLITRADEVIADEQLVLVDAIIGRAIDIFDEQTRGYGQIVNRTAKDAPMGGTSEGGASGDAGSDGGVDATAAGSAGDGATAGSASGGGATGSIADGSGGAGSGDGSSGAAEDDAGGCGCTHAPAPTAGLLLGVAALVYRRRRA